MACLIKMDSKKFVKDFCKEFNPHDFHIILVSKDITTKGKYENVFVAKDLFPTKQVFDARINAGTKEFELKYLQQLQHHNDARLIIASIVKSVIKYNLNVVLLCSESEEEYGFIDIIADYIETVYKLETVSFKQLKKKGNKLLKKAPKNIEEIEKTYIKVVGSLEEATPSKKGNDKEKEEKKLRKELYKLIDGSKKKKLYKLLLEFSDFDEDIEDCSKQELQEVCIAFVDSLNAKRLNKLRKFFK